MEIRFIILNILPQDTQTLNHKKRDTFKPFRVFEPFFIFYLSFGWNAMAHMPATSDEAGFLNRNSRRRLSRRGKKVNNCSQWAAMY